MNLYKLLTSIIRPLFSLLYKIEIKGEQYLPEEGAYIVAANHIHNFDPVLLACFLKKREIHYLAKKELFKYTFFAKIFDKVGVIPIDRNKNDINAIKKVLKLLKSGEILGIFPQGTRVKSNDEDSAKAGLGMFSIKTNTPIIPVRIDGNYKFFSNITITIFDVYMPDDEYKDNPNQENYINISNKVMDIIKLSQKE